MIRLLIFILSVVFFAAALTILLTLGQSVQIAAFGWKMDVPAGVAAAFVALVLGAFGLLISLYKDFTGMRRRRVLRGVLKRREKGVEALVGAASAHVRADYAKAAKLAQKASKLLDRDDVIALFAAPASRQVEPETEPVEIEIELEPEAETPTAPVIEAQPAPEPAPAALPPPAETPDPQETLDRGANAARRVS